MISQNLLPRFYFVLNRMIIDYCSFSSFRLHRLVFTAQIETSTIK